MAQAPGVMNDVRNSTQTKLMDDALAEDRPGGELSPFTLVVNTLKRQGLPITPDNIRRAVIANARETSQSDAPYVGDEKGDILRNYAPSEDVAAKVEGGGSRRSPPADRRTDATPVDKHDEPKTSAPPQDQPPPVPPRAGEGPDGNLGQSILFGLPPPTEGARVGGGSPPQLPPPPAGAAAVPPPPDPLQTAMQRAIGGPGEPPMLPAPPETPQLSGPRAPLALPAPEVPVAPQIAAPPAVPALPGPSPQLALPAPSPTGQPALPPPQPRITIESLTGGGGSAPGAAPGTPVQGYPIEQTPASRAVRGAAVGAARGARGGVPGAIAGGLAGAAPEVAQYILKNLHLY